MLSSSSLPLTGRRSCQVPSNSLPPSRRCTLPRQRGACRIVCKQGGSPGPGSQGGKDEPDNVPNPKREARNQLELTIRRKSQQVEAQLKELGLEGLEERLQSGVQVPANPPYRLSTLISECVPRGKCVLVFELVRPSPATTPQELAALAKSYVEAGADALVVPTDSEHTASGLRDLWAVTQAVKVPVVAKDWLIHPLQVVEMKEAGAAGALGVIGQVNGRATALLSSFSASLGLDAPVEVVNAQEVAGLAKAGVVFYAINVSVGLSLPIPGFSSDIAHGILGELPFGTISMVGVKSLEEARKARLSGADSLFVKGELISAAAARSGGGPGATAGAGINALRQFAQQLEYLTSGDD